MKWWLQGEWNGKARSLIWWFLPSFGALNVPSPIWFFFILGGSKWFNLQVFPWFERRPLLWVHLCSIFCNQICILSATFLTLTKGGRERLSWANGRFCGSFLFRSVLCYVYCSVVVYSVVLGWDVSGPYRFSHVLVLPPFLNYKQRFCVTNKKGTSSFTKPQPTTHNWWRGGERS